MKRFPRPLAAVLGALALFLAGLTGVTIANAADAPTGPPKAGTPGPSANTPGFPLDPQERARNAAKVFRPSEYDLDYVAIKPCRILDTRLKGGVMSSEERLFGVVGNLTNQGGASNCGIPDRATTIDLNLTAISQDGSSGYVRGRSVGAPEPTTSLLNFSKYLNASNMVHQAVAAFGMRLKVFGKAHLVGDVQGYFVPKIEGLVVAGDEPYQGTPGVKSTVKVATGVYNVTVDRDVTNCSPFVTPYYGTSVYASAYTYGSNIVRVYLWTLNGTAAPVPYNGYFYLTVVC